MGKVIITKMIVPRLDFLILFFLLFVLVKCWYKILHVAYM